jgi:translocation and assembly module TamB
MTRNQIHKRAALAALILVVLGAVAGFFALRSRAFHRYVLAQMVSRVEKAVGGKVQIGDFTFHASGLRADLYRVAIHGTEPSSAPPLLWVDHIGANFKIVSLFGGELGLRAIEIDHPVIHFIVDASGRSNLPGPSSSQQRTQSKGPADFFRLAVNRFGLRRGEINVNDRQIPLEADLRGLQIQGGFEPRRGEYRGSLRYQNGEIQLGDLRPVDHTVDLRFGISPTRTVLEPLVVRTGNSRISIQAAIENYAHPSVTGSCSLKLAVADAAHIVNSPMRLAGEIDTSARFNYQNAPKRALLDSLSISGRLSSPALSLWSREVAGQIGAVRARYSLEHGNFTASGLEADVLGGRLSANLAIRNIMGPARGTLTASAHSISLDALAPAILRGRWAQVPVHGSLNATANASWHGNLNGLRAHSDAAFNASVGPFQQPAPPIPLQGNLHATYDAQAKTITFQNSVLQTPQSEVSLNGNLGDHSSLAITAESKDLHATGVLITQLRRFATPASRSVRPLGLAGRAAFRGTVQGSMQSPALSGQLTASSVRLQQAAFPHLQTQLAISSSKFSLGGGSLEAAHGKARFQASVGLKGWEYNPSAPASLQLTASNMSVADLEKLAQMRYPVSGILSAEISVHGSPLHPVGAGTVQVVKAEVWKQPVRNLTLRFNGTGNSVQSALRVQTPAGNTSAHLTYNPQSRAYNGEVNLEGIRLGQLQTFKQANIPISGVLSGSIEGRGTLKEPQGQARISIPALRIGQQVITNVSARATVANQVVTVNLSSDFAGTPAHMNGTVRLSDDYQADVKVSTGTIDVGRLLAAYAHSVPSDIKCQTGLQAWLKGPLKQPSRIEAEVQVPTLQLSHQSMQISSVAPITVRYHNGMLVVNPVEMKGTESDFRLEAAVPLKESEPFKASATGTINLHIVQLIHPDWTSSGQLRINIHASGSRRDPDMRGQVQIVNAAFEPPDAPLGVSNMNATIALSEGRAEITRFKAESGEGTVEASGSVAYAHGAAFSLAVNANHVRLRYPEGVREVLDSNLRLSGTPQSALIAGEVSIDQLSLTPSFDLASFANQFNVVSVPLGSTTGFTNNVKLNVALRSARELSLSSSELHMAGTANLRVQGTLSDPVIVGRTTISGGELFFNRRRYQLESGVIDFLNPVTTQPVVNVRVETSVDQYRILLTFIGPFDHMRTTYSSDPSLSEADIVHLLITGQAAESTGTGLGAQSILAQGVAGQVSNRVQKLTGVSSLTIDPQMGGNGSNPGARIAVQQRVTSKLFFTFSVDTSTSQDDAVQLEYHFSRRWSVQALRDQAGGYSLEIRSHRNF